MKNFNREKNIIQFESSRCMMCKDAPCTSKCTNGSNPSKFIQGLALGNFIGAKKHMCNCKDLCDKSCEQYCIHYDNKIRITYLHKILSKITDNIDEGYQSKDVSIDFLGIKCENPFFLGSSIIANNYEMCAKALEMGWGGIVYKTIGKMKLKEVSPRFDTVSKQGTPFVGFRNIEQISLKSAEENFEILKKLKKNYKNKVIGASIMGQNEDEWEDLARMATDANVDFIECNFSCPNMVVKEYGCETGQSPELVEKYVIATKKGTNLPVLAKMTPNITDILKPSIAAYNAGADGLVAINTIKSLTGINPEYPTKTSISGYSGTAIKPIALKFVNDITQNKQLKNVPLSASGGITTWLDALEFILLGASNLQITTAVMQYGYRIIEDLVEGLKIFMMQHNISSLSELVGSYKKHIVSLDDLDRDSISFPMFHRDECVKCGRCHISCYDAGHQAINWDDSTKTPHLNTKKCTGCHLCIHVCPSKSITPGKHFKLK